MNRDPFSMFPPAAHARHARREIEAALDRVDWRWSRPLSLWLDALTILEETAA